MPIFMDVVFLVDFSYFNASKLLKQPTMSFKPVIQQKIPIHFINTIIRVAEIIHAKIHANS